MLIYVWLTMAKRGVKFTILIEKDEDCYYVASVAELPGCHTQARTIDELMERIREAITAYLEAGGKNTRQECSLPHNISFIR